MTSRHPALHPMAASVLASALVAGACTSAPAPTAAPAATSTSAAPPSSTSAPPPDTVTLSEAARAQAGITIVAAAQVERADATEAPGLVTTNELRTARVGALVEGSVVDITVQAGQHVGRGSLLAYLHSHIVHDAQANHRKALAEERRGTIELQFATDAQQRAERLLEQKAVALQDVQRARANRANAAEALDIAKAEVQRSVDELHHYGLSTGTAPASGDKDDLPVRSPIAGVVLERLVTQGTAVTSGTPLFIISDLSTVWVLAELNEAHLSKVSVNGAVSVRVPAYPGQSFPGKVTYIGETVNPKSRRITIRCEVPNQGGLLKPEMYATVLIGEGRARQTVGVPSDAIQQIGGRTVVFVVEGQRFHVRPVEAGEDRNGITEIRSGLAPGERVAGAGAFVVKSELLKSTEGGD